MRPLDFSKPYLRSSFASSWIQPVTSVSAGPPVGGLYLKPPSSGGLCDGVTTMPSARPSTGPVIGQDRVDKRRGRVHPSPAGEDVDPSPRGPRAPSETRARQGVGVQGHEQGPVDPVARRYRATAALAARMWLLVERGPSSDDPRCPRRPECHALFRDEGSGLRVVVGGDQPVDVDQHRRVSGLPGPRIDGHGDSLAHRARR